MKKKHRDETMSVNTVEDIGSNARIKKKIVFGMIYFALVLLKF